MQSINPIINLTPTSINRQGCNYYVSGKNVIVESVAAYLARVPIALREPGLIVTVITNPGIYDIDNFRNILSNASITYYRFEGGLTDDKFIQIYLGTTFSNADMPKSGRDNVNKGLNVVVFAKAFTDDAYEVLFEGNNEFGRVDGKWIDQDKDKFSFYITDDCSIKWIAVKH